MINFKATAKKIMELFHYFKIKDGDTLSLRLFLTRKYLWRELEEEEVNNALKELILRGYITAIEDQSGWTLLKPGAEYLKQQKR